MRVEQFMTKPVITCRTYENLVMAAHMMSKYDCGMLIAVSDDGNLQGIITDRDVCLAVYTRGLLLHDTLIGDVMAKVVCSCRATDNVSDVLEFMRLKRVRRIPVVDERARPIGIVTIGDIALAIAAAGGERVGVLCEDVVLTLSEICEPCIAAASSVEVRV